MGGSSKRKRRGGRCSGWLKQEETLAEGGEERFRKRVREKLCCIFSEGIKGCWRFYNAGVVDTTPKGCVIYVVVLSSGFMCFVCAL